VDIVYPMPPRRLRVRLPADKYHYAAKKRVANRARMARPSRDLVQEIKKVVAGTQETKFIVDYPFNTQTSSDLYAAVNFSSGITSTNELYNLIPRINVGSDDHQRIGNRIQPVSLYNTTTVFLPYSEARTAMSVFVDVYYLTSKTVKTDNIMANIPTDFLLNAGDGTNVPYDGTAQTADFPINKAAFTLIKHKRVKLQLSAGDPNSVLVGSFVNPGIVTTCGYTARWKLKIPTPSVLTYMNENVNYPTNSLPFMCLGFHAIDANGDTAPITPRIFCRSQSQMYYKDA